MTLSNFKSSSALAMIVLSALSSVANAQVTMTLDTGYDDNPFRLSEPLNNDGGVFLDAELRLEADLSSNLSIDLRGSQLIFDNEDQDADRTTYSVTLAYEDEDIWFGKNADYLIHGRFRGADRTFVSRLTGEVGAFRGDEIGDRFDQRSFELRARSDVALSKTVTLRLQGDFRNRNYDDFSDLGLTDLDYNQLYGSAILRVRPNRAHDIRLGGSLGHRDYSDRPGRELDGSLLVGSQLNYDFYDLQASWMYDFAEHQDVRFEFDHRLRRDNLSGYFDTTYSRVGLRYRYRPNRQTRFAARIRYGDLGYDNIPAEAIINNEENVGPNDGISTSVSFSRRLRRTDGQDIWLNSELTYNDFDSVNESFVYDRLVAKIGISAEF